MVRARLWFRCAAVGDPVSPVQVSLVEIGWEAKKRKVDLVIERSFTGEELLQRMKGWITVNPQEVIEAVKPHGRMKLLDDRILVVEMKDWDAFEALRETLASAFPDRVDLEAMTQKDQFAG